MGTQRKLLVELREKSDAELEDFVNAMKKSLFELRAEALLQNKVVKRHLFSLYKKNIAKAKTIQQERKEKSHG